MSVISVDLAYKRYRDIGVVALQKTSRGLVATPVPLEPLGLEGAPQVGPFAAFLETLATELDASSIMIDGPQAWKDPANGLEHSRRCERELATQGKTGLPGSAKPANYLDFMSFSIDLFTELSMRGFPRLELAAEWPDRVSIESFPTGAWRSVGLTPLPGKARASDSDVAGRLDELRSLFDLTVTEHPTHDELQAVVAGLAGIAFAARNPAGFAASGVAPFELAGSWREGYILNPTREAAA